MSSNAVCCCFCGQTGTFVKEFDRKYRSREIIDGVKEKCIADHIVSPDIVSWNSLYNNDESGDSVPLVPIMACTASWRDVKRGGRKMCHIANIFYNTHKYHQQRPHMNPKRRNERYLTSANEFQSLLQFVERYSISFSDSTILDISGGSDDIVARNFGANGNVITNDIDLTVPATFHHDLNESNFRSHFAHLNIDVVITSPPYSLLKDEFLYELVSLTSKWLILKVPFQFIIPTNFRRNFQHRRIA